MGKRRRQFERVWQRDGGLCGIHLQGCGKRVEASEGDVGHIIPKTMSNRGHLDEHMSRAEHKELRRKHGVVIGRDMNVQPMHRECNEAMKSVFPPWPIRSHCDCCVWVYEERRDGRWEPILGLSTEEEEVGIPEGRTGNEYQLSRWIRLPGTGGKVMMVGQHFAARMQVSDPEGPVSHSVLLMMGRERSGKMRANKTMGNLGVTLRQMHRHNMSVAEKGKIHTRNAYAEVARWKKDFRE